jgi:hypothetical protein
MGVIGRRWGVPFLLSCLLLAASVVGGQEEGGSGSSEEEKKMKRHTKDNPKCTCTHDRDYIGHYVGNLSCPVRPQERIPVAFAFWYTPDHPGAEPYWHDPGFRGAMKGLETNHSMDVVWYNLNDEGVEQQLLDAVGGGQYAYVFSKGCWHTPADKFMRGKLIHSKPASVKTGLFPACSSPPPPDEVTGVTIDRAYDTIFYDKMWLKQLFEGHPNAVFAFGIDSPNTFNKTGKMPTLVSLFPLISHLSSLISFFLSSLSLISLSLSLSLISLSLSPPPSLSSASLVHIFLKVEWCQRKKLALSPKP